MTIFAAVAQSILLLLAPAAVPADTAVPPPDPWIWFPVVTGAPETGLGAGLVAGWFEGGGLPARPSSVVATGMVTAKGHRILSVFPELYLLDGRLEVSGELQAQKYPDAFFGVGPTTTRAMEEAFTSRSVTSKLAVRMEVRPGIRVGALFMGRHDRLVETEGEGLLRSAAVPGAGGGTTSGVGVVGMVDTRDNLYAPRQGVQGELSVVTFEPAIGSDYAFRRVDADLRHFRPVGERFTLAARVYAATTWGDVPFYELPQIGAQGLLRGYLEGRFRDRAAAAAEVELRVPLAGRFGAAMFAGVGGVGPDLLRLPVPSDVARSAGVGLRYALNDGGVNLRVDYGVGREGGGLYLGIGEAF